MCFGFAHWIWTCELGLRAGYACWVCELESRVGGATWTGENRSVETEKVLARGVRSIRVVLRVLEIWSVTVGNETDERCKDFTKQIGKWRAGNVRGDD